MGEGGGNGLVAKVHQSVAAAQVSYLVTVHQSVAAAQVSYLVTVNLVHCGR